MTGSGQGTSLFEEVAFTPRLTMEKSQSFEERGRLTFKVV